MIAYDLNRISRILKAISIENPIISAELRESAGASTKTIETIVGNTVGKVIENYTKP